MIVRCTDCSTKYEIAASKIPDGGVRVRCPKCKAVFPVRPTGGGGMPDSAGVRASAVPLAGTGAGAASVDVPPSPAHRSSPKSEAKPAISEGPSLTSVPGGMGAPKKRSIGDPQIARRMARAVVQELLLARQQEHQRALGEGTVLRTFGPDIADAFDLYADKVSEELPERKTIFLEAVNDVLGNGRRLL